MKKYSYAFLLFIIFTSLIFLITAPNICVEGARSGILLWFNTIVPTLFPFFVVTKLIIELNIWPDRLMPFYPVFVGMLSGYPAGAMTIGDMVKRKHISKNRGQILMIFCNNASPIFMISYVTCYCLNNISGRYIIWLSVIPASVITAFMISIFYHIVNPQKYGRSSDKYEKTTAIKQPLHISVYSVFEQVIIKSCEVLLMIGAYIIIFSIAANIILCLPIPDCLSIIISGFLEITTGVNLLSDKSIALPAVTKYVLAASICGFGGISALLQTKSAIKDSGLSVHIYFFHKLICGLLSGILCYMYITAGIFNI